MQSRMSPGDPIPHVTDGKGQSLTDKILVWQKSSEGEWLNTKENIKGFQICVSSKLFQFSGKKDFKEYKITPVLKALQHQSKRQAKNKWESVLFISESIRVQNPWLTPTSPFFQLIPWKHSKIKRFDTVPSESGLQKMCIHILFSSAKYNVITAVQSLMCALTKPRASSLAEGYFNVCPAERPSSAPGASLEEEFIT